MRSAFQRCADRIVLSIPFAALLLLNQPAALCQPALRSAASFAVLGGSTITNTGTTLINGDLGVFPGSAYTGAASVVQSGGVHLADAVAQAAETDLSTAYNYLAALPFTTDLSGDDLGGLTLDPGVYRFSSSAQLTGTVTLDAQNNQNALFVFEIGSTLTTASNAIVHVVNGTAGTGVFWQIGTSATLGTGTAFAGNILALTSITLDTTASITCGRALAENGAVTLDANIISDNCGAGGDLGTGRTDFGSAGFAGEVVSGVPEPPTLPLLCAGLALILFGWRLGTRGGIAAFSRRRATRLSPHVPVRNAK
jgi:type VI secretion system secreted protein VgrG